MAKDLEGLISEAHKELDAYYAKEGGGPPPAFTKHIRELLKDNRRIANTPDDQLSVDELSIKKQELAESKRLVEKFGNLFEQVFGTKPLGF